MSVFSLQSHPENVLAVFIAIKPIEGAPRPWADSHRGPPKFSRALVQAVPSQGFALGVQSASRARPSSKIRIILNCLFGDV
jgi:hypothetical protein